MRKTLFLSTLFLVVSLFSTNLSAQTNSDVGIKANFAGGEVTSVAAGKIVLQTKDGVIELVLTEKTEFKRIPPDNTSLKAAIASSLTEIGVGDKLLVTGIVSADKKTIPAKAVYLITKSDIVKRQTDNKEEWRTRGTVGKVVSFNPQTNIITISVGGMMNSKNIAVKPKDKAEFYRYTSDSIEFSNAKKGTIVEIDPGDEIRVLGDKNADGSEIAAEKIVTGGFKTIGGVVKTISVEKNELIITDYITKKDITIVIGGSTILKQFPAEMAQRMAQIQTMQAGGGQGGFRPPTQGNQQTTPPQNPPTQRQPNGTGQGGGMRSGGFDDSRFQNIKIADLKVGEMIGVLSMKNADPNQIKAIKLFTGVEPFIKMQQTAAAGQGGGRNSSPNFSIPGLDGFGGN